MSISMLDAYSCNCIFFVAIVAARFCQLVTENRSEGDLSCELIVLDYLLFSKTYYLTKI